MTEDRVRAEMTAADGWAARLPGPIRLLVVRFLPRGALVLSVLSFAYLLMGQLRNRVLASKFGLSEELDIFYVAFRIPEVALDVLVAAGLTAPFVPIFSTLKRSDERAANEFGRTVLTAAVLVMAAAMLVLIAAAPLIADQVANKLSPAGRALYVDLFRINCLGQIVFAASIAIGEVLVANRRFVFYALAPILYTAGIAGGTLIGAERFGIYAPALGAVVGAILHLAIRSVGTLQTSFRIRPQLRIRTAAFREFVRLMLPRMVSYPIDPILLTFFGLVALEAGTGSASALSFADDYRVVPVILVGQQFSLAVFPALSAAYADRDLASFRAIARRNVVTIGGVTLVGAILLGVAAPLLVEVLLGGGAFGSDEITRTATVLAAFAVSVPLDSLSYPLSRALYATHNTQLQVIASVCAFAVIIVVTRAALPQLGIVAVPVAYAVGTAVKVALLGVFLTRRLRSLGREALSA
jgi:putative peptidoglycan lipid II flippase